MTEESQFEKRLRAKERDDDYLYAKLITDIAFQLEDAIAQEGITQTELAQRLGVSKSYVTRILNGQPNMTIRTLVKFANALNRKVSLQFLEFGLRAKSRAASSATMKKTHAEKSLAVNSHRRSSTH